MVPKFLRGVSTPRGRNGRLSPTHTTLAFSNQACRSSEPFSPHAQSAVPERQAELHHTQATPSSMRDDGTVHACGWTGDIASFMWNSRLNLSWIIIFLKKILDIKDYKIMLHPMPNKNRTLHIRPNLNALSIQANKTHLLNKFWPTEVGFG